MIILKVKFYNFPWMTLIHISYFCIMSLNWYFSTWVTLIHTYYFCLSNFLFLFSLKVCATFSIFVCHEGCRQGKFHSYELTHKKTHTPHLLPTIWKSHPASCQQVTGNRRPSIVTPKIMTSPMSLSRILTDHMLLYCFHDIVKYCDYQCFHSQLFLLTLPTCDDIIHDDYCQITFYISTHVKKYSYSFT